MLWTEALTRLAGEHVPDAVYDEVRRALTDDEIASLSVAIIAINGWNQINVAFRTVPGSYLPVG